MDRAFDSRRGHSVVESAGIHGNARKYHARPFPRGLIMDHPPHAAMDEAPTAPGQEPKPSQDDAEGLASAAQYYEQRGSRLVATMIALAGALLAGLGQLAGSGVLATYRAPIASRVLLIGAMLSILSGIVVTVIQFVYSRVNYLHYFEKTVTQFPGDVGKRQARRKRIMAALQHWPPWVVFFQVVAWTVGACGYAFILYWITINQ